MNPFGIATNSHTVAAIITAVAAMITLRCSRDQVNPESYHVSVVSNHASVIL